MTFSKKRLFTPGPTPVLPEAVLAMSAPILNHRKDDFKRLLRESTAMLKSIYKTENDVLILTSSGTGAMESAVTNFLSPGDRVLVVVGGKFGERWEELCRAFRLNVVKVPVEWGDAVDPIDIEIHLERDPSIRAVFLQACESSTGVANDIARIGHIVARYPRTLLVVDAITGLGTMDMRTDEWYLDVVIGGSQKAFMLPPGLAFVSVSTKAWEFAKESTLPKFYYDLTKERASQGEGQTAFTPAISLIQGLHSALTYINRFGVDHLIGNAALLAKVTRAAVTAIGLRLVARSPADAMTAVYVPKGIEGNKLVSELSQQFGIVLSGGQGKLKGKIFRIAHLGYYDLYDTMAMISCLEIALQRLGYAAPLGEGVKAALQTYLERTKERMKDEG
jgi:aspartate aminotransferase-like enzyme